MDDRGDEITRSQSSFVSSNQAWDEEEIKERKAIDALDHDDQWPSVHKPVLETSKAKEFNSRLTDVRTLGNGSFGRVDRVKYGSIYLARKCVTYTRQLRKSFTIEDLKEEASIMRKLKHRHVVKLVGVYLPSPSEICLLIWPLAVCDLHTLLDNLDFIYTNDDGLGDAILNLNSLELNDFSQIKPSMAQKTDSMLKCPLDFLRGVLGCITRAMASCHLGGIRHLDIKPSNILLRPNQVYLADFGISKDVRGQELTVIDGNPGTEKWRAPECYNKGFSMQLSDIYSLGLVYLNIAAILYNIRLSEFNDALTYSKEIGRSENLTAREKNIQNFIKKVCSSSDTPQDGIQSRRLMDLIANMTSPTPITRLLANEINEILSILGGTHQIYYNQCCKLRLSLTEPTDETSTALLNLEAENKDLQNKITELYSKEETHNKTLKLAQEAHDRDITELKASFKKTETALRNSLQASNAAKSANQRELEEVKLAYAKLAKENSSARKNYNSKLSTSSDVASLDTNQKSAPDFLEKKQARERMFTELPQPKSVFDANLTEERERRHRRRNYLEYQRDIKFIRAQEAANAFTKKPTNDELSRLYALFKIGKGFKLEEAEKPGMFDLQGKAKFNAWRNAYEDEGITGPIEAQEKYIEFVESLKDKYQ